MKWSLLLEVYPASDVAAAFPVSFELETVGLRDRGDVLGGDVGDEKDDVLGGDEGDDDAMLVSIGRSDALDEGDVLFE